MLTEFKKGDCFTICLWTEDDGSCETLEYLQKLGKGGKREKEDFKTLTEHRIKYMADHGAIANPVKCKDLGDGIYEFKAGNGARLLWFYDKTTRRVVICTNGFHKPTSKQGYKSPIKKAKAIRKRHTENHR